MSTFEQEYFKFFHWEESHLKKSSFIKCQFESCQWIEVDWRQVRFVDCLFKNCNISLAKMDGCHLQNTQFIESKLVGIDFFKCEHTFFSVLFEQTILQTCHFADLKMKKTSFQRCKLRDAYFTDCDLTEANFTHAELQGAIFHHCNLTKADFTHAKDYNIDLQSNTLKHAKFSFPEAIRLLNSFDIQII
jgi:fluoroquinolone resistance protein